MRLAPKVTDPQTRVRPIDIPKDVLMEWEAIARRLAHATPVILDRVLEVRQPSLS